MTLGALAALTSSVTWAYASARYAQASRDVGSQRVNLARALVVFPIYTAWALATEGRHVLDPIDGPRAMWLGISMICSYAVGDNLFLTAARKIGISTALAIASTYPLWAALAGVAFSDQPLGWSRAAGCFLCVGGVVVLVWKVEQKRADLRGVLLAVGTSILWAGNSFATQKGATGLPVATGNAIRYGVAMVLLYAQIRLFRMTAPRPAPTGGWRTMAGPICADALFGSVCYVYGLSHTDLAVGATLSSLAPLVSVPVAIALGEEKFSVARLCAVLATVGGIVLLVTA